MKTEKQGMAEVTPDHFISPKRYETKFPLQIGRTKKISEETSTVANNQNRRFIDEKQYSAITEIALPTLRRWRHERKGPSYIKIGRMVRYDLALGLEFMDSHKIDLGG